MFRIGGAGALGVFGALAFLAFTPVSAGAVVSSGCTASEQGGSYPVNLNSDETWRLKDSDTVTGQGTSKDELNGVTVNAVNLGLPAPIYASNDKGHGGNTDRSYLVSDYSKYTRVIYLSGTAGGGACSGHIKIVVDDRSALTNLASLVAIVVTAVGLLLFLGGALGSGLGGRIVGALGGLLAGLGLAILAEEFELLDPSSLLGLALPLIGLVLGAVLAGRRRRRPAVAV